MKKTYIEEYEFANLSNKTRGLTTNCDVNELIEAYEYLKEKKFKSMSLGTTRMVENAHIEFLSDALNRTYFYEDYNIQTEEFLKSHYLSEEIKNEILCLLAGNCRKEIETLLKSDTETKDFTKEEIKEIRVYLAKVYKKLTNKKEQEKCSDIHDLLEDYFFVLDGEGPIEYIKEDYGSELPNLILDKSAFPSIPTYYAGYGVNRRFLGEDHLFSMYKKYVKFYPDKKDEFVNLVKTTFTLTPTEFIINYFNFVINGFNSDFNYKRGNMSLDGVYGETRDIVGVASLFSSFRERNPEFDFKMTLEIKKEFLKKVEDYERIMEEEKGKIIKKKL
jgi:hypothetical protein